MAIKKEIELEVKVDSVGTLKQQLKEAQREVEALAAKFGATSEQATNAAKKAAELKDQIGDAKALTDAFNPDAKFAAFGTALQGVAGGFSAVQGAMGLIGVESSAVEATLLKVQSAMALSQGINSVIAAKDSFTNLAAVLGKTALGQKLLTAAQVAGAVTMRILNAVMAANPIFLIIAAIGALVGAFAYFTSSTETAADSNDRLNESLENQQDALNRSNDSLMKAGETRLKILQAQGASEKDLHDQTISNLKDEEKARQNNFKFIQKQLKEKNKILAIAYEEENEDLIKSTEEELKILQKKYIDIAYLKQDIDDKIKIETVRFNTQQKKIQDEEDKKNAEEAKQKQDEANKLAKERRDKRIAAAKAEKEEQLRIEKERLANLKNLENQYLSEKEEAENDYYNSKLTDEQLEVQNTRDKYFLLIEQAKIYGQDSATLEEAQKNELAKISDKYRLIEKEAAAKAQQDVYDNKKGYLEAALIEDENNLQAKKDLLEVEKEILLQNKELTEGEIAAIEAKYRKDKEQLDADELEKAKTNQRQRVEMASNAIGILQDAMSLFTANNEKDARRNFKINKALSLSSAVVNTAQAITAALATKNPLPFGRFIEAGMAAASGAVSIAKIAGTQFGGFGGGSGGGGNKPSTPNNMTQGVITPNFNIVGNNGQNQLGQLGSPIQAYVVSSDMTSQQQLDRNRLRNATF